MKRCAYCGKLKITHFIFGGFFDGYKDRECDKYVQKKKGGKTQ
jgi:hypothetical protein